MKEPEKHPPKYAGMITVEAALIVPYIYFVVMAVMYMGFYYLDQAKVYAACDEVMYYASQAIGKGTDVGKGVVDITIRNRIPVYSLSHTYTMECEEITERLNTKLKGKLLLLKGEDLQITITEKYIVVSFAKTAEHKWWEMLNLSQVTFSYQKKVQCADYSNVLRKTDAFTQE